MYNKYFFVAIAFLFFASSANAQQCNYVIKGQVIDESSGLPLSYVHVILQELQKGVSTDEAGNFIFEEVCLGTYHLLFSHIGWDPQKIHVDLPPDSSLLVTLVPVINIAGNVVVEGKKTNFNNQANVSINRGMIEDNVDKNLAGLLENEAGVHLLKNGNGVSKPIVQGHYGNRLLILNNGVAQSGQQWGNDHAPEIDPNAADKITVLKGASALAYGGANLGSAILIQSKKIKQEPHLHGQLGYVFESNGQGHNANFRLGKYSEVLAWRLNGTLRKYGDRKTPNYYLNNTGQQEASFSLQLEKVWKEKLFFEAYLSTFNTELGVLRGSHIGNLTDLQSALTNEIPFFTEPNFSYEIEAPRQAVAHHLAKLNVKYLIGNDQSLDLVLAGQLNDRKEFDVRRGDRTDIPALSIAQYTFNAEMSYQRVFPNEWILKAGTQNIFTDNTNNPETGILPLIPDYLSWKTGLYSTLSRSKKKMDVNMGIRYDYEYQSVVAFSRSVPREILRYDNRFKNVGAVLGLKYAFARAQTLSYSFGYAMRNPAINELYSNGLHQGVSGIEEGDERLSTERGLKNTLEYQWFPSTKFSLNTLLYHQRFEDYIYLNPQDEFRLTIRGAFPVFKYEQTDASIFGLDISSQFMLGEFLFGSVKYSFIKGQDLTNNEPLVNMPTNRLFASLSYKTNKSVRLSNSLKLEDLALEINEKIVFRQNNLLPEQDFVLPPPTYTLLGLKFSTNIISAQYKLRFFTKVDNLLNLTYRDYLNRQRYFADDAGISVSLGINFKF